MGETLIFQLPYYIDGDVKITETSAIMAYIGRKYNLCKYNSTLCSVTS